MILVKYVLQLKYKKIKLMTQYILIAILSITALSACGQRTPLSAPQDRVEDSRSY